MSAKDEERVMSERRNRSERSEGGPKDKGEQLFKRLQEAEQFEDG